MQTSYQTARDFWTHRDPASLGEAMRSGLSLVGFGVEASDGVPAGLIGRIDFEGKRLRVDSTKDEIESAPECDGRGYEDEGYRAQLSGYYCGLGTHPMTTF